MVLPAPPSYNTPIPNNPFYSTPTYFIHGALGPLIIGSGLNVNYPSSILDAVGGGGGGGVSSITGSAGIGVSSPVGNVTLTNTGVLSVTGGAGINVSAASGNVTITNTNTGTVSLINTGTGLTGGPISSMGTIALATTGVTASTYTNPTITVDAQGRITAASNNSAINSLAVSLPLVSTGGANPTLSINAASTTACGAVQLSDSTASTSSATAATSLAVKTAYDVAIAAIPKSCITAKGSLITGTAASIPATLSVGANGQFLVACSTAPLGICWATVPAPAAATPTAAGLVLGCTTATNTALGCNALLNAAITGGNNIAIGLSAGSGITSGCCNTLVGVCAGVSLTTGDDNVAIGYRSLPVIAGGQKNVAIGCEALSSLSNASQNIAIGAYSLGSLTSGGVNVSIGEDSGSLLVTGDRNSFIGYQAGRNLTSGSYNVAIGNMVDLPSATGNCQLAIGFGSTDYWLTGNSTKAIAPGAGIIDCAGSCGSAGQVLMSNGSNAICWGTLTSVPSATPTVAGIVFGCTTATNTALGCNAGGALTTGTCNIFIGRNAGLGVTTGGCNTIIGNFTGSAALSCNVVLADGLGNIKLQINDCGAIAPNTTSNYGAAGEVLTSCGPTLPPVWGPAGAVPAATTLAAGSTFAYADNTGSNDNTALGYNALGNGTAGYSNVAIGCEALSTITSGNNNISIGWLSGQNLTTESNNILLDNAGIAGKSDHFIVGATPKIAVNDNNALGISDGSGGLTYGNSNQVLTSSGTGAPPTWKSVNSVIAAPNYGSFLSTATQTVGTINVGQAVALTPVATTNFSLVSGSQITAAVAGTYNIQISLQIISTGGGGGDVEVWFVKNGLAIGNSSTRYSVKNANEEEVAALNLIVDLAAGDNIQVYWASNNAQMTLAALLPVSNGPSIPSAIVTIVPVGA